MVAKKQGCLLPASEHVQLLQSSRFAVCVPVKADVGAERRKPQVTQDSYQPDRKPCHKMTHAGPIYVMTKRWFSLPHFTV